MSKRRRSNSSKRFESPDNKRRKLIKSDCKLINLDETRKRRKEAMAKSSLNFRYNRIFSQRNFYFRWEVQQFGG